MLNSILKKIGSVFNCDSKKKEQSPPTVALVLSGGGARGFAHIGAIEAIRQSGYEITSIAGTSMGALVGGLYAVGKINQLREIASNMNRKRLLDLLSISPGLDHIAGDEKLLRMIDDLIGDVCIENLPIDFCCCASDVVSGKEIVFRNGLLKDAVRASISIPCFFKPVLNGEQILVDGSIHNPLPLDRVTRHEGDILVSMNVSAPDDEPYTDYMKKYLVSTETSEKALWNKLAFVNTDFSANYFNMALRVAKLSIQNCTQTAIKLTPPDISAEIPMQSYGLLEFEKGKEIIALGRKVMEEALADYNSQKETKL